MADVALTWCDAVHANIASTDTLHIAPRPLAKWLLRGDAQQLAATLDAIALSLPPQNRLVAASERFCLRQSPTRCLLAAPMGNRSVLDETLRGVNGGAVIFDAGSLYECFQLEGPAAADCINSGCSLDLRDAYFGIGACAGTRIDRVPVHLARLDTDRYLVFVERPLAMYLQHWLGAVAETLA